MKCRVRIAKIALHEKFPGINNEGQALDINDPNHDDSDYSEIFKVVRSFLFILFGRWSKQRRMKSFRHFFYSI